MNNHLFRPGYRPQGAAIQGDMSPNPEKPAPPPKSRGWRRQYGALPYRQRRSGEVEFLLITSRETGRWVIPKGWPKKGKPGWQTAEEEAYEEAGIKGQIGRNRLARYRYMKWMSDGPILCVVTLFPLRVVEEFDHWPEEGQRICMWAPRQEAAQLVEEPDLSIIMLTASFR